MGALVGGESAPSYFLGECSPERGQEEHFPRPWKLPTAIGKPAHQTPRKSEPSPVGPSWLPSGWQTVPGSPQDSLSDKSPTSFCLNTLEEANQS